MGPSHSLLPIMLPGQFARALRRNGPALARWPAQERDPALALLRVSGAARRMLADALEFPGDGPEDAAALARLRIGLRLRLASVRAGQERRREWGLGGAALAACAVVGIVLGSGLVDRTDPADALGALLVPSYEAAER